MYKSYIHTTNLYRKGYKISKHTHKLHIHYGYKLHILWIPTFDTLWILTCTNHIFIQQISIGKCYKTSKHTNKLYILHI